MEKSSIVVSYTLRCCFDAVDTKWRFYLRHVQTGEEKYCSTVVEVQSYLRDQLTTVQQAEESRPPEGSD